MALRLARPDLVSDLPHQLQLLTHAIMVDQVAARMAGETALRAHPHPVERLLAALTRALGHDVGGLVDAPLHLLLVLQLREL